MDTINQAFDDRSSLNTQNVPKDINDAILETIEQLDRGEIRVAEKCNGEWTVNEWIKKAVLLFFKTQDNIMMTNGITNFFDKVPLKFSQHNQQSLSDANVQIQAAIGYRID